MDQIKSIWRRLSNQEQSESIIRTSNIEDNRPVFIVATGRSGTHFLAEVLGKDPFLLVNHLDDVGNSIGDSFVFYVEWNKLPIDQSGFIHHRRMLIKDATSNGKVYVESNPYLAFSIETLNREFNAKFIHIYRDPIKVINSHYVKGWYKSSPQFVNTDLALGYQYDIDKGNHSFGRIVPNGRDFERWSQLTQIGKIAWMWNVTNIEILKQLDTIDAKNFLRFPVEDIDYDSYLAIQRFVGGNNDIDEKTFTNIVSQKPGKGKKLRSESDWTDQERDEFLKEVAPTIERLGIDLPISKG